MAAATSTTQSLKGMRYAVAAMALRVCGAFQQPRTTRGTVALRAKPKVVVFDLDGCLWEPEMCWAASPRRAPRKQPPRDARRGLMRVGS